MKLATLALLGLQGIASSKKVNWQKPGLCGVQQVQPNVEVFEDVSEMQRRLNTTFSQLGRSSPSITPHRLRKMKLKASLRIVGGKEAKQHSWPWQVYVVLNGIYYGYYDSGVECGGTLVDNRWIITAAHCVGSSQVSGYVRVGIHNFRDDDTEFSKRVVKRAVIHPGWDSSTFENDIALLELVSDAIVDPKDIYERERVTPLCLPNEQTCFDKRTPCVVTGWGVYDSKTYARHSELQEVAVRLMPKDECTKHKTYANYVKPSMVCAGYEKGGKDACAGDSGGPLMCRVKDQNSDTYTDKWVLYGVVSWGIDCAKEGQPGIYTSVPAMYEWIHEVTGLKSDKKFRFDECQSYNDKLEQEWADDVVNVFPTAPVSEIEYIPEEEIPRTCGIEWSGNVTDEWQTMNSHKGMDKIAWARNGAPKTTNNPYDMNNDCILSIENTDESKIIQLELTSSKVDCKGLSTARSYTQAEQAEAGDMLEIISVSDERFTISTAETCNIRRKHARTIQDTTQIIVNFSTDRFRALNKKSLREDTRQKFDIGFQLKYRLKSRYHDCEADANQKLAKGDRVVLSSENYGRGLYSYGSQCRFFVEAEEGATLKWEVTRLVTKRRTRGNGICNLNNDDSLLFLDSDGCKDADLFDEAGVAKNGLISKSFCGKYKKPKRFKPQSFDYPKERVCIFFSAKAKALGESPNGKQGKGWQMVVTAH
jgi:hypothetical protein